MIIRHPHVFGDVTADTTEQVLKNWDAIKMETHSQKKPSEAMNSVSKTLPSLIRSEKLQKKANRAGLDYTDTEEVFNDVSDKLDILKKSAADNDTQSYEKNIGELLFSVVALSRFLKTDCEQSLYFACDKFTEQFQELETLAVEKGIDIQGSDAEALSRLWNEISKKEKNLEEI